MKNREKTALKTIPWDFPAVHWLRLHTRGPRSGTPQAAITSPNAATAEPAQPDSLLGFLNTPSLLTHTDAEAGPRPPRRHLREQGHLPFPATTGPALSEQLSRRSGDAREAPHQTQKAQSQPLEGRSSGPCWFLGRPLPDGTDHGRDPRSLCAPPSRTPSPQPGSGLRRAPPLTAQAGA